MAPSNLQVPSTILLDTFFCCVAACLSASSPVHTPPSTQLLLDELGNCSVCKALSVSGRQHESLWTCGHVMSTVGPIVSECPHCLRTSCSCGGRERGSWGTARGSGRGE